MLHLYFRKPKREPRWFPGDQHFRNLASHALDVIRERKIGGVERVFLNLCQGLDQIGVSYRVNQPFKSVKASDQVGVLGLGKAALDGYCIDNEIIAGIGLMTHPSEWPDLCSQYPIRHYLQHSKWAADLYRPYYGSKVALWPAGIDTERWIPASGENQHVYDLLLYNKISWNYDNADKVLVQPIRNVLIDEGISFIELRAGTYNSNEYLKLLHSCRAMVFLCSHESQGLACQEAMATGLPILAWDQGFCLDPNYDVWECGRPVPATSVPFFDERCGIRFRNAEEFSLKIHCFMNSVRAEQFDPRAYILETLTLEKSAMNFLNFFSN